MPPDDAVRTRAELLLRETAWLRQLVLHLAGNVHDADDVVQDVGVLALTRAPHEVHSVRAWLTAVAQRVVQRRQRRAHLGARRLRDVARSEAQPSAHEVVARVEAHRRVVEAVLALEEPYRSVVLLRFFEARKPAAIAAALGCPVATVRTRLQRGLLLLRGRLEARLGPRHTWAPALGLIALRPPVTLAAPAGAAQGLLGMSMKKLCACGAITLAVSFGSFLYWSAPDVAGGGDGAGAAAALAAPSADLRAPAQPALDPEATPPTRTEVAVAEPAEELVPDIGPLPPQAAGELVVLVLDQAGRRIVGARVLRVLPEPADAEQLLELSAVDVQLDQLEKAVAGRALVANIGRYEAAKTPEAPVVLQLAPSVSAAGTFELSLADAKLSFAGAKGQLHSVPLLRGLFGKRSTGGSGDRPVRLEQVGRTGRDGTCRVPLAGDQTLLAATSHGSSGLVALDVPAGGATVVLEVRASSRVAGIVVDAAGRPLADAVVEARPDAGAFPEPRWMTATTDQEGRFAFALDPFGWFELVARAGEAGSERLRIDAEPATSASVRMRMLGAVVLQGVVVDPGGSVCAGAAVRVVRVGPDASADPRTRPFSASVETAADGSFRVLLPSAGDYLAGARHDAWAHAVPEPVHIGAGSVPPRLRLSLVAPGTMHGTVRWQDGFAVEGAEVTATPTTPAPAGSDGDFVGKKVRAEVQGDGSYRLEGLVPHVRYRLVCVPDPTRAYARAERTDVVPSCQDFTFDREALRGARLRLLLQTSTGEMPAGTSVLVSRRTADGTWQRGEPQELTIEDGQAWIEGLQRGTTYAVELRSQFGRCRTDPFVAGVDGERMLRLTRPGSVDVVVHDENGRPLLGARVVLREPAPEGLRRDDAVRTSDVFGHARWDSVSVLPWTVFAEYGGRRSEVVPLALEPERQASVVLTVER